MLVSSFLFETFTQDVCAPVIEPVGYATMLRRKVMDIAAKIGRHGGRVVLKVTAATIEALNVEVLWQRSGAPPKYCWSSETCNAEKMTRRWGGVSKIAEI